VILLDTSGLVANYNRRDRYHTAAARILERPQQRVLSPFVLAELDYLLGELAGQEAELLALDDVARGAYQLEVFGAEDVAAAVRVISQYADLRLGLADASIIVLAARYRCLDVLTLDQRHFRAVRGPGGAAFRLLPLDP
jgi:predicted nucleic acid-binding protein